MRQKLTKEIGSQKLTEKAVSKIENIQQIWNIASLKR